MTKEMNILYILINLLKVMVWTNLVYIAPSSVQTPLQLWKPLRPFSSLPTSIWFFSLYVIIFGQGGHLDGLKQLSCITLYYLQENIKYNLYLLIIQNITATSFGGVWVSVSDVMIFTRIFKYFDVLLEEQTSLKSTPFDEFNLEGWAMSQHVPLILLSKWT